MSAELRVLKKLYTERKLYRSKLLAFYYKLLEDYRSRFFDKLP